MSARRYVAAVAALGRTRSCNLGCPAWRNYRTPSCAAAALRSTRKACWRSDRLATPEITASMIASSVAVAGIAQSKT